MEEAKKILSRYRKGICTPEELEVLHCWFDETELGDVEQLGEHEILAFQQAFKHQFMQSRRRSRLYRIRVVSSVAAVAAILLIVGGYMLSSWRSQISLKSADPSVAGQDIRPGGHKAILTLADGQQIHLEDHETGFVVSDGSVSVKQEELGLLVYDFSSKSSAPDQPVSYNTIQTPQGGTFQVMLPDGTTVWLNNATTLRYPVSLNDQPRIVELLEGEAFFQVSHRQVDGVPQTFTVQTGDEVVEVLGTEFNISAYPGEPRLTTLIKGAIQIGHTGTTTKTRMHPGQQATFKNGALQISEVDPESVYAWKEGYFLFDDETLENIMKKVARWYDVEVHYGPNVDRQGKFWGSVSKFENVDILLEKLELTGAIRFEINGRRVLVMK